MAGQRLGWVAKDFVGFCVAEQAPHFFIDNEDRTGNAVDILLDRYALLESECVAAIWADTVAIPGRRRVAVPIANASTTPGAHQFHISMN